MAKPITEAIRQCTEYLPQKPSSAPNSLTPSGASIAT